MPLDDYRKKRDADRTPEPFGGEAPGLPGARGRFVVQLHHARHVHFDLRLEIDGVLVSWAVPKGPSLDPDEKRLAVKVEDHPLDYADFEGRIPEGNDHPTSDRLRRTRRNYGAGTVIVWDKGTFVALEDLASGMESGKLLFELFGYKLRGVFTLVRTKRKGESRAPVEWLLIKKPDRFAVKETTRKLSDESVLSGLTVSEIASGKDRGAAIAEELAKLGAKRGEVRAAEIDLMLAESADAPFSAPGYIFELKYDGFRLLAERHDGQAHLFYRRGSESTAIFPDIARAIASLPWTFVLDGEVVSLDDEGRPQFAQLQQRTQLVRTLDIARASALLPATYFAFDLLAFEGFDLRPLPLSTRKALLARLLPKVGPIRFADHVEERGAELFEQVEKRGMEGVMAKQLSAPYRAGRSSAWLKVKAEKTGDFVVVGTTLSKGGRPGFGALELAVREGDAFVYAGRVGSGFSDKQLGEIPKLLTRVAAPPCSGPIPREKGRTWVKPELVVEVRYQEWTDDGILRFPVFLRLRSDKAPKDCRRDAPPAHIPTDPEPPVSSPVPSRPEVRTTNPGKVFWPDDGITKGELVTYYRSIAPFMLPYLRDRPLVLTRYPDGIRGKSFFQHDAPVFAPTWIRTERLFSEHAKREVDYFVCDDVETLAYLANLGTIPIHAWGSRVQSIQQPDWCSIDLDPKGAPLADVTRLALALRALCDEIGLPCFVKTSGQAGLHVLVPMGAGPTHEQARTLAYVLASVIAKEMPDIATLNRVVEARGGRVYLDTLQNGHGRTLVAPFSVRPVPGASVSMPLRWDEVGPALDVRSFTLRNAVARMEALGADPFAGVLGPSPDIAGALDRLGARMRAAT